jgi:two-component system, OmpR family, manganese sensing response regulator
MAKILIIEDDEDHCRLVAQALKSENHTTESAHDGKEGLHRMLSYSYDLIICDWMLPSMPGVEICKEYRKAGGTALVLMLTGKTRSEDIHTGLDAGADDYLGKPFFTRELLARVRALLRRAAKRESRVRPLHLNCQKVRRGGETEQKGNRLADDVLEESRTNFLSRSNANAMDRLPRRI